MADDEPQAIKALAHSLKNRPAKVGPTATDAEKMWDKLEGLMTRLCDGDIGATVVKGASDSMAGRASWACLKHRTSPCRLLQYKALAWIPRCHLPVCHQTRWSKQVAIRLKATA
jgi:hypothetical protein